MRNAIKPPSHDPEVCGIDLESSCEDCREQMEQQYRHEETAADAARRQWDAIRAQHGGALRDVPSEYPTLPPGELLAQLAWATIDPKTRPLLRQLFLDLLDPDTDNANVTTLVGAARGVIAEMRGQAVPEPERSITPLSDRELRRIITSFGRRPEAAMALMRALKHAAALTIAKEAE